MKLRMTKQRKALFEKMKSGVNIVSEHTDFGGHSYSLSDGAPVSRDVVEGLIYADALEPCGDGMFGISQSYRLRDGVV